MGLLENFEPPRKQTACKVRSVLNDLTKDDKEILTTALKDTEKWAAQTLSNALKQRGISIADASITKHRKGLCSCLRD